MRFIATAPAPRISIPSFALMALLGTGFVGCQAEDGSAPGTSGAGNGSPSAGGASGTAVTTAGATNDVGGASTSSGTAGTVTGGGGAAATSTTSSAGGGTATSAGGVGPGGSGMGGDAGAGGGVSGTSAGGLGGMAGVTSSGAGGTGGSNSTCDSSPGMAMQFAEGVIDQMTANIGADGPSGDGPRTLELWAKFTSANSWTAEQTIIELGRRQNAGDMVWGIDMSGRSGNGGRFGPYTNGVSDNNGDAGPFYEAAPDVGWLHLSWAYEGNGGELVFTVNGEQLPVQDPGNNFTLNLTPGIITLGASQSFGATGWDGVMDEVRVWTVYRSPQQIADTMRVFLKGDEEGLAAYYDFDEGDGSYVDDVNGTASHRLEPCTAGNDDRCTATNDAMPTLVVSDIPGPFTCAEP